MVCAKEIWGRGILTKANSGKTILIFLPAMMAFFAFLQSSNYSFGEEVRVWKAVLQIKIEGELFPPPHSASTPRAHFVVEAEWHGFLEEDGLDFIIYHLESYLNNWKIWSGEKNEPELKEKLMSPIFRLDYVEGLEKEVRFYYSFSPSEIAVPGQSSHNPLRFLLPSSPWPARKEPVEVIITRQGSRVVAVDRKALEQPSCQKEFLWKGEIPELRPHRFKESFSVWLRLELKKLK